MNKNIDYIEMKTLDGEIVRVDKEEVLYRLGLNMDQGPGTNTSRAMKLYGKRAIRVRVFDDERLV